MRDRIESSLRKQMLSAAIAVTLCLISQCRSAADTADPSALLLAGYNQLRHGAHEQAVETFSAVVQSNPASIEARKYLAYALLNAGLAEQAVTQYEYLQKISSLSAVDLTSLGNAYFYCSNYKKAISTYRQALSQNRHSDDARVGLVHTYVAAGDTAGASLVCEQALQQSITAASHSRYEDLLRDIRGDPNVQHQALDE